ncbi:MAG TPA: DUF3095 domain-containing protein [Cyanobacteria bacterium UBA8156]|nr:DUF3095 domain-containing protein [Cyanobacteria bacterium UBA8156]
MNVDISKDFYDNLLTLDSLWAIAEPEHFTPVPSDWFVALTDVVGSTQAIAAGRYKEVNMVGACSIVAALNAVPNRNLPFVFGGDGATLLVCPRDLAAVETALLGTQAMARQSFGLELRVGIVPVADVTHPILVAKLALSPHYHQALLAGGGIAQATALVKHPERGEAYRPPARPATADFTGLECRWQDIPSPSEDILSLIVIARSDPPYPIYRQMVQMLQELFGGPVPSPVTPANLRLAFRLRSLATEMRVFAGDRPPWQRGWGLLQIWGVTLLGWLLMGGRVGPWRDYKAQVVATTDFKKFEDGLRMVLACNQRQRETLLHFLEQQHQQGNLDYGWHRSDRAHMTCLIFERFGHQVHFVDGADGGYALAAQALKQRQGKT